MNMHVVPKARDDFVFRSISENDIPAFMSLYRLCFPDKPSEEFIWWRYFGSIAGPAPTMLAFDQNNICVSSLMFWPVQVSLDGNVVMAAQGVDAMTHPDYRGRGLFVSLVQKGYEFIAQRGYRFFFSFPNDHSLPIAARYLNWDHVCDIPRWTRPLWMLGNSALGGLAAATSLLWSPRSANGLCIETEVPNPDAVAALAVRHEEFEGICRVKRGRQWFSWRYLTNSSKAYQWVAAYDGGDLTGVGVWRVDPTTQRAYLCELIGDTKSNSAILNAILRAAFQQKVRAIEFPTNDAALVPVLKAHGFIRRSGHHLVVHSLTGKTLPANIHKPEAWRVYGGDIDYL